MNMRLLLLLSIVGLSAIVSLIRPYIGLLCFTWLAYFRPQNWAWGTQGFKLSFIVGIPLIIGTFANIKQEKISFNTYVSKLLILLFVAMLFSCFFSFDQVPAFSKLRQMSIILLIAILTSALVNTSARFKQIAWLIAISFGILTVKGALRGIFFGWRLEGPAESMIADNNDFALALNMVIPFFFYLGVNEKKRWGKNFFYVLFTFTIIAIMYTFSRGGFVGLCAVMLIMALKSKRKIMGIVIFAIGAFVFFRFAPQDYKDRMETIKTYKEDMNVMSRIYSWEAAWAMAKDRPLTGVGLNNFVIAYPNYHWFRPHVAHNSYLQILAETGFPGLFLFILILLISIIQLRRLRKMANAESFSWFRNYTHMLEVGLIGYMVSGFFLSREDFDLMYQFIGMVGALEIIAKREKIC